LVVRLHRCNGQNNSLRSEIGWQIVCRSHYQIVRVERSVWLLHTRILYRPSTTCTVWQHTHPLPTLYKILSLRVKCHTLTSVYSILDILIVNFVPTTMRDTAYQVFRSLLVFLTCCGSPINCSTTSSSSLTTPLASAIFSCYPLHACALECEITTV
jgi:hypothetical protein